MNGESRRIGNRLRRAGGSLAIVNPSLLRDRKPVRFWGGCTNAEESGRNDSVCNANSKADPLNVAKLEFELQRLSGASHT